MSSIGTGIVYGVVAPSHQAMIGSESRLDRADEFLCAVTLVAAACPASPPLKLCRLLEMIAMAERDEILGFVQLFGR